MSEESRKTAEAFLRERVPVAIEADTELAALLDEAFASGADAAAQRMGGFALNAENVMLTGRLPKNVCEHIRRVAHALVRKGLDRAATLSRGHSVKVDDLPERVCLDLADKFDEHRDRVAEWL